MTIYAIKAPPKKEDVEMVFESLIRGEGRFGWSDTETADLRELKTRINEHGWDTLSDDEKDCWHPFLLDFQDGDYVVIVNAPEWGKCTLAKVTGEYRWRWENGDFNHRFPVDPASVKTFDRNDAMVEPALSTRLKLRGRHWTIYAKDEFMQLVKELVKGTPPSKRTPESERKRLSKAVQPHLLQITESIQSTYPGTSLEGFVAQVFERVPGIKRVTQKGGPSDHGADLIVDFEFASIPGLVIQHKLVVQVKSYEGELYDARAVSDIDRAFNWYPDSDGGLIVSTATEKNENFDRALDKLREKSKKPVSLLIGTDLAAFVLKYGGGLLS